MSNVNLILNWGVKDIKDDNYISEDITLFQSLNSLQNIPNK